MPTTDIRPAHWDIRLRPGNTHPLELTWPADSLDGRTFTATVLGVDDEPIELDVDITGDTVTVTFEVPEDTPLRSYTWQLTETTVDEQVLIVGRLLLSELGTDDQDSATIVITDDITVAVSVLGEPGPTGADGPPGADGDPGVVQSIVAGDNVTVDDTDPANPIVSSTGGGSGATNLAYTAAPTQGVVTSDTGTDATLPAADGTNAGLMLPAEKSKLAGVEPGATADLSGAEILALLLPLDGPGSGLDADSVDGQSSAALLARANHTGAQAISTVTGLQTALDDEAAARAAADALLVPLAQKGAANGVATLGADSKIPTSQIPAIALSEFLGAVASEVAMLALTGQRGDWAVRTDFDPDRVFILESDDPTQAANWTDITTAGAVNSVDGRVGTVVLSDLYDAIGAAAAAQAAAVQRANHTGTQLASTVSDFDTQVATTAVLKALFDANTILAADTDNTPAPLSVLEQRVVGRITGGNITGLTAAQIRTLINVEDGATADQTAAEILTALLGVDGAGSGLDADLLDGVDAASFVRDTGDETIAGVKTFSSDPLIPDEAYDATAWNGVLEPPTKNAVRDQFESLNGTYDPLGAADAAEAAAIAAAAITAVQVVVYDFDTSTWPARPAGPAVVRYVGPTQPADMEDYDEWRVLASPIPDAPTGLGATAGAQEIALDWDDNTELDFDHYEVRSRVTAGPGAWSAWVDVGAASATTVTGLTNGTGYDFEVRAVDHNDNASTAASTTGTPSADAFNPDTIVGLRDRWFGEDQAGAADSAVSSWVSRVGLHDAVQADGAKQPVLRHASLNGKKGVDFDGAADLLRYAGALASADSSGWLMTVIVPDSLAANQNIVTASDEATTVMFFAMHLTTAGKIRVKHNVASGVLDEVEGSTTLVAGTAYLIEIHSSGTAWTVRVNGNTETLTVINGANTGDWFADLTGIDNFVLGGLKRTTESGWFNGKMYSTLLGNGTISAADLEDYYNYVEAVYGITLP